MQDQELSISANFLDAMGGEMLAGSGFEKEDPETEFAIVEGAEQE